jgi:isocitrate/isopropylmalate dehydrogenase
LACIRSAALLLQSLGRSNDAQLIDAAVDQVLREGTCLTPDLGGTSGTKEVTEAVVKKMRDMSKNNNNNGNGSSVTGVGSQLGTQESG